VYHRKLLMNVLKRLPSANLSNYVPSSANDVCFPCLSSKLNHSHSNVAWHQWSPNRIVFSRFNDYYESMFQERY